MTMPIFTWNGMISSSMHLTHFSRWPGRTWYCRSSKIMRASRDQSLQRVHHRPALESVYDRVPVIRNLVALSPPTLPDTPPIEYVEAAAAAGYDAVGLRLARSPLFPYYPVVGNAPLIRELKVVLASSGLSVLDILSFYLQPATDLDSFAPALALGAELGARYALVAGDDPDWARLRDHMGRFCDMAARFGIAAALEFAVIRPLATLSQALRLLSELGRKNGVVCLDPLNFVRGGGSAALLRGLEPRLFPYAQISDGVLEPGEPDLAKLGRMSPNQRRLPGGGASRRGQAARGRRRRRQRRRAASRRVLDLSGQAHAWLRRGEQAAHVAGHRRASGLYGAPVAHAYGRRADQRRAAGGGRGGLHRSRRGDRRV